MDFQKLLENKSLLYGIIGAIVIVLALFTAIGVMNSSKGGNGAARVVSEKVIKEPLDLLTTDNLGKAIEIQALLAREGIDASRKLDGTKSTIFLKQYTLSQKDAALLAIVKSGLMDQNVGLEIFDKGDFTSTKEDKRIRLARAINGELARLIRKIPPIENASVFISIPEQTMFTSMQKPVTATVQITIPIGDKLDQIKVKAITNLLLGSVTGLTSDNIAITDTNGNVYTSIIDAQDEMLEKLQENDKYMQHKVAAQLDRLIGKGNYVVTVSTFLRQAPVERFTIEYDPNKKTAVTEQNFTEGLGDQTQDVNRNVNAVSVYLPNGLPAGSSDSSQNRSYSRSATETQYGVTKVQTNEYIKPGVVEEISIAVTLEKSALPANTTLEELKQLIANAASPKAEARNVSIAFSDSTDPYLASDRPVNLPKPDETGNPWWLTIALSGLGLLILFKVVSDKVRQVQEANQQEVDALRAKAAEQDRQLNDINSRAAQLTARQSELAQNLLEQQQREYIPQQDEGALLESLANVSAEMSDADADEAGEKIKSWIEQG
ncbi:MAG: hypothetical protein E7Z93_03015 [Cyanobacteria bacterium SIG32]|nr:hypothetical protein [Cyanobacteria bacterium SIG32]